jgi:NADPH:quinone reductase-like Zn-dependent oxidoreductase
MKAAVFHEPNKPLRIEEIPEPAIRDHEVLVKVAACGVCHTDLHYIDHGVPTFKKPPLVLGHEASGVIAKRGKSVTEFKEGDTVLLPAVLTCGTCEFCRTGRENICQSMMMFGNNVDGAYAEYVAAPAKDIFHLPPEIPLKEGSIIADAISTPFHAVKNRAEVKAGDHLGQEARAGALVRRVGHRQPDESREPRQGDPEADGRGRGHRHRGDREPQDDRGGVRHAPEGGAAGGGGVHRRRDQTERREDHVL